MFFIVSLWEIALNFGKTHQTWPKYKQICIASSERSLYFYYIQNLILLKLIEEDTNAKLLTELIAGLHRTNRATIRALWRFSEQRLKNSPIKVIEGS